MTLYCGSSGFSFKEWKGPFYPEKLPAADMLSYYGERLPTVEINATFYRMPKRSMLEGWLGKVSDSFRFAIKAPRRITHSKKLKDCSDEIGYFFRALDALDSRLGIVLFQLPPHARIDVGVLKEFLTQLPGASRAAFEFRHASWHDDAVFTALEERGATWVVTDNDGTEVPDVPRTARTLYLRLRAESYTDKRLADWKSRCDDFDDAFVYFKHEDGGAAPKLALRMLEL